MTVNAITSGHLMTPMLSFCIGRKSFPFVAANGVSTGEMLDDTRPQTCMRICHNKFNLLQEKKTWFCHDTHDCRQDWRRKPAQGMKSLAYIHSALNEVTLWMMELYMSVCVCVRVQYMLGNDPICDVWRTTFIRIKQDRVQKNIVFFFRDDLESTCAVWNLSVSDVAQKRLDAGPLITLIIYSFNKIQINK